MEIGCAARREWMPSHHRSVTASHNDATCLPPLTGRTRSDDGNGRAEGSHEDQARWRPSCGGLIAGGGEPCCGDALAEFVRGLIRPLIQLTEIPFAQ